MLIVHDDPTEAYALRRVVAQIASRVMVASGGQEGLRATHELKPDLILCDLAPDDATLDGEISAGRFRQRLLLDPELAHIPFVVISTKRSKEAQLEALRLGAADYLLKPLSSDTLKARLVHFLESRQVRAPVDCALSGPLDMIPAPSLFQCLDWNRSTGILHLTAPSRSGHIVFKEGTIVDARIQELSGEDALIEMISFDEGSFVFDARPAGQLAELFRFKVQNVIMDAGWIRDELAKLAEMAPASSDLILVSDKARAIDCFGHPAWATWVQSGTAKSVKAIASMLGIGCQRARVGLGDGIRRGVLCVSGRVTSSQEMPALSFGSDRKQSPGAGARLMLIEDDREVHRLLVPYFEAAGFEVHAFDTGARAAENAHALQPAMVIVDGLLPGVLGPQVAQSIRRGPPHSSVPIVLLSSFFNDEPAHDYLRNECGVNMVIHKSCDARSIVYQVVTLFEKTRTDHRPPSLDEARRRIRQLDEDLDAIRRRYRDRIPERIEALRHTLERWSRGDRAPLHAEAHRLRGSAAMLGYPRASELLGKLELQAMQAGASDQGALSALIGEIEEAFRIAPPSTVPEAAAAATAAAAKGPGSSPNVPVLRPAS